MITASNQTIDFDILRFTDFLSSEFKFFAGVPDSVLKDICALLAENFPPSQFLTAANEGNAVALCAGYTLATGKPGVVYMQNSGFGNALNPLLSLNDAIVYNIPVLLLIGWRGEPGVKDEQQHQKQGLVTRELLDICKIPYRVLSSETVNAVDDLQWAVKELEIRQAPVALLIRKGIFSTSSNCIRLNKNLYSLSRKNAVEVMLDVVSAAKDKECRIVATTGMISRELYEIRKNRHEEHACDFLSVGSMGHASSIALGIALCQPNKQIICLDGDGAALMHMGALTTIGTSRVDNFIHVVFNNAAHDSVGGHPTCADQINLPQIALACGYTQSQTVLEENALKHAVSSALIQKGRHFIDVKVALRKDDNLPRPSQSLEFLKKLFCDHMEYEK